MRKVIFLVVVFLELSVIAFLAGKIYFKQSQILGENININPIPKEDIIFPASDSDSDLKNFYEPKANKDITKKPGWLPLDYAYTITINEDSLNERFDYALEKNPDVFRIAAIGDSFTYGLYVNTRDNYPERFEDLLNDDSLCGYNKKFEVINLGYGGYDIEYSVERFKVRGQKYNPDLVLWFVKDDDFFGPKELVLRKERQYEEEISADEALLAEFYSRGSFYPWG